MSQSNTVYHQVQLVYSLYISLYQADEHMLLRCYLRMAGLPNIHCYQAEAATSDWGLGFDVVNAAKSLRTGGHLYLDFDLHYNPAVSFSSLKESR